MGNLYVLLTVSQIKGSFQCKKKTFFASSSEILICKRKQPSFSTQNKFT
ncbi:hypothetical protein DOY81_004429 [Sarcophaga bullata]|nr:hypothetical protein DOY81_004429 [Sarcophaga bullata]